ncbi:MAG: homocysteine S-methyltransferase family protein [Clostridia bacterium]|nr:homocysteine S-methyltransferase family protein [Clostridia bacterium]
MNIKEFLKSNILTLDGGMGTLLQKRGLKPGELPERWNISHPDVIRDIHSAYFAAGSRVVSTNTFGANTLKFDKDELESIVSAAVRIARDAADKAGGDRFVALDIGPTGHLLKPFGDLDFEDAVAVFAETVKLGVRSGVDLILIETMNDSYETKAALLAAKENSSLPVFVSNAYSADGKLMTGATPEAMCALLEGMGADAIGMNCSLGPRELMPTVRRLLACASVPVILKPNAGLPSVCCGETVYNVTPDEFAEDVATLAREGVRVVGGCCGTTPEYIRALSEKLDGITPVPLTDKCITAVSSYTHTVAFGEDPVLIGERINPTGKKRFKQALRERDMGYILSEAFSQRDCGVSVLDVNVGLPEIDELRLLTDAVCEIQAVCDLPLQIDSTDTAAMESALRRYNGKAMINSVSGKAESMASVFPLAKKYGGVIVALTLDEDGIPSSADGRVNIARRILMEAEKYGISRKDIVFDTLAMTVSADGGAAKVTLEALERIKRELGCHTSLGVSNVSFGLPCRDTVNSTFFACALERGLSAAIMNPYSEEMMRTYHSYRALHGLDAMCSRYISFMDGRSGMDGAKTAAPSTASSSADTVFAAVRLGMKERAAELTRVMLESTPPLDIVKGEVIPALDEVGRGFEAKTVYLPSLLMSAEAAKAAFEEVKLAMSSSSESSEVKCPFVIATVKGDIHDIGKNIVKLLLENYGFAVHDLGRDVPPEDVVAAVLETGAPMVGLSALMTTTVPAMEETIRQLREKVPGCLVVVGGAVLTEEYASMIGADKYAADAMETVRYAEEVYASFKK